MNKKQHKRQKKDDNMNISISKSEKKKIKKYAEEKDIPVSRLIRQATKKYMG